MQSIVFYFSFLLVICMACSEAQTIKTIVTVHGDQSVDVNAIWLSHEHILVDFIGADSINPAAWQYAEVEEVILPHLNAIKQKGVKYFVDATPAFLGRHPRFLQQLSEASGLTIITNTGWYGARSDQHVPEAIHSMTHDQLSRVWIDEFNEGIGDTGIRPGFIKIGVDPDAVLDAVDRKLVMAAILTHQATGMTIASHTGGAAAFWPQVHLADSMGLPPQALIWVHAQNEDNDMEYVKAADLGYWISLDGLGWDIDRHFEKLVFAKEQGILDHILISHDAGWFDPQKKEQSITPYTDIFDKLIPRLQAHGFSAEEINKLLQINPVRAFSITTEP